MQSLNYMLIGDIVGQSKWAHQKAIMRIHRYAEVILVKESRFLKALRILTPSVELYIYNTLAYDFEEGECRRELTNGNFVLEEMKDV